MWDEIMKIFMAVIAAVFNSETTGKPGDEKYAEAKAEILKEVKDPGGIHVTNRWVLAGLDVLIPAFITFVVWQINRLGLFTSLKQK